jgi:hypothetical protein
MEVFVRSKASRLSFPFLAVLSDDAFSDRARKAAAVSGSHWQALCVQQSVVRFGPPACPDVPSSDSSSCTINRDDYCPAEVLWIAKFHGWSLVRVRSRSRRSCRGCNYSRLKNPATGRPFKSPEGKPITHSGDRQKLERGRDHQKKIFHQSNEILVDSSVLNIIDQLSNFFSEGLHLSLIRCSIRGFIASRNWTAELYNGTPRLPHSRRAVQTRAWILI